MLLKNKKNQLALRYITNKILGVMEIPGRTILNPIRKIRDHLAELEKSSNIPENLRLAYQREWAFETRSDINRANANKRWNKQSKNK